MPQFAVSPLLITFIGYGFLILNISYVSTKLTSNLSDYVLGGRRLSGPVTALGAGASDMGSWLLMALPGLVYVSGINILWMPIALLLGAYCNWRFVAKRIRIYTEVANDSLTIPEFLSNRFKDNGFLLRLVTSLAIIIFFTYYSAAGFASGAILIQHTFPSLDYVTSLLIGASVIIVYTAIGGFLAVSWVDFFQGILMLVALIVVPTVTVLNLGGLASSLNSIHTLQPDHLNLFKNVSVLGLLSLFAWGLGYFGQLHINTRFMAIRSTKELPMARLICMNWMTVSLGGAFLTGLFGFLFYYSSPLSKPDTVFLVLAQQLFNPWVAGILLSAVSAAIMNSVSAQILMSASIILEDFYHKFLRKNATDKENLWAGRIILFAIASVSVFIASDPKSSILQSVGFAWSGLGSSFGPVLLFSLFWRNMTKSAAIAGIIAGTIAVLSWGLLSHPNIMIINHPDILPGFEMIPGFIASTITIIIVSKFTTPPSQEVIETFNRVEKVSIEQSI